MTQEVDLRRKFRLGSLVGGLGGGLSILGALSTVAVWAMFGAGGLAGEIMFFDLVVFLAVFGLQQQIDSLLMALRGARDESDFSKQMRKGMDPTRELQQLRSLLGSLQEQLVALSAQRQAKQA